ncbi:MAG: hypothetical protein NC095_12120 [Muribaculum sp.]|nr:hypothetical protein [Muribaculum sp.]
MSFSEFVATKLDSTPRQTIDYKAMISFLTTLHGYGEMSDENRLRIWIANIVHRGLTMSSRKRYIEKLHTIYNEYRSASGVNDNAFDGIAELKNIDSRSGITQPDTQLTRLEKIFDIILADAKTRPELAVFLYLLFNASTDIENAVYLTADDYKPLFPQLDDIIRPEDFHHSRKYVFDLQQSRKRTPQLVREVLGAIDSYLRVKEIRFPDHLSPATILSLWILKASKLGVGLSDLKCMLGAIPAGFEYLHFVSGSQLSAEGQLEIKHRVAEAFSPSGKRWYAMKVWRNFDFDRFKQHIKENFSEFYDEEMFFYPVKQVLSRIDKKIVTKNVPVIPDVVFFHVRPRHVRKMDTAIRTEGVGWIFRNANNASSDYSVIDTAGMALFQRMIGIFTPDVKIELTPEEPMGIGRDVIITGGIMAGYRGRIYDIKEGSDVRQIYIRLSDKYSIKAEATVDEFYVQPIGDDIKKEA